jgi:hypothetical protein
MLPRLTVGMATYNDFDGCYFTVQSLRLHQKFSPEDIEIVIVDNAPGSTHSSMLQQLCMNSGAKYVPLQNPVGTSPSRNKVFEVATGEFVLCMDSHVILVSNAIERLLTFLPEAGPHLYQGPMLQDDLQNVCTHFNPQWRSEMYGTWGRAWACTCRPETSTIRNSAGTNQFVFTMFQVGDESHARKMPICSERYRQCPHCSREIPQVGWAGHERILLNAGFVDIGTRPTDPAFDIPGQGLGLFGCRRDAWLQFHPHAIGFGAEELNIHELYRQQGRRCISLPFLTWLHKFGRPNGVPYPLDRYHKVRNYILWHLRIGKPLDDIREHFLDSKLISQDHWDYLVADPVNHIAPPSGCGSCGKKSPAVLPDSIEAVYQNTLTTERDFNQHMPKLRELAENCGIVADISIRQESFIALAASKAKVVYSYSNEHNPLTDHVAQLRKMTRLPVIPQNIETIPQVELLFLNTTHSSDQVYRELNRFADKVSHYIVLHNTTIYGETGEGHTQQTVVLGILHALRRYMREHPEWTVIYHSPNQYGLTVISRLAEDKQQLPGKLTMVKNFMTALAEHVVDGNQKSSLEVFESRLDICSTCPHRTEGNCSVCGCDLKTKAAWKSTVCPLGMWPEVSQ